MSADYFTHTAADAAIFEQHRAGSWSDGPTASEVAEMRPESAAEHRAAVRAAADELSRGAA